MKNDWLTTSSFERAFEIVAAINILSIQAKLTKAHAENPIDSEETNKAQSKILAFLDALEILIGSAKEDQSGIVLGADPRLGELALHYMAEQHRLPPRSILYTFSIHQLKELIQSQREENLDTLVECLTSLRSMIEQYSQADVAGLFGEE